MTVGSKPALDRQAGFKLCHEPLRRSCGCLLLDELTIELVPTLLGGGIRLLDAIEPDAASLQIVRVVDAPGVTHLTYQIRK